MPPPQVDEPTSGPRSHSPKYGDRLDELLSYFGESETSEDQERRRRLKAFNGR